MSCLVRSLVDEDQLSCIYASRGYLVVAQHAEHRDLVLGEIVQPYIRHRDPVAARLPPMRVVCETTMTDWIEQHLVCAPDHFVTVPRVYRRFYRVEGD